MFIGTYTHRLDKKGRISLPAAFRNEVGKDFLLSTRGDKACLIGYPASDAEKLVTEETAPFVEALNVDKEGRVVIKQKLRDKFFSAAEPSDDDDNDKVVIVGHKTYFSIWRKSDWEKEEARLLSRG